jgi:hypothetical protein
MDKEEFSKEYIQQWDIEKLPDFCHSCNRKFDFTLWDYEKIKNHIIKCMEERHHGQG